MRISFVNPCVPYVLAHVGKTLRRSACLPAAAKNGWFTRTDETRAATANEWQIWIGLRRRRREDDLRLLNDGVPVPPRWLLHVAGRRARSAGIEEGGPGSIGVCPCAAVTFVGRSRAAFARIGDGCARLGACGRRLRDCSHADTQRRIPLGGTRGRRRGPNVGYRHPGWSNSGHRNGVRCDGPG